MSLEIVARRRSMHYLCRPVAARVLAFWADALCAKEVCPTQRHAWWRRNDDHASIQSDQPFVEKFSNLQASFVGVGLQCGHKGEGGCPDHIAHEGGDLLDHFSANTLLMGDVLDIILNGSNPPLAAS